jgi:hypothetical protein
MAVLDKAAHRAPDGTWTFQCPGIDGSPCGDLGTGQPFVSSGWPTKVIAQARGRQHLGEHKLEADVNAYLADHAAALEYEGGKLLNAEAKRAKAIEASDYAVMPSLDDFRAEHGLTAHANGIHAVQIEGLS